MENDDDIGAKQVPVQNDAIFLDHIAHWVSDPEGAREALLRLGFLATCESAQTQAPERRSQASEDDGASAGISAGASNRCVMLRKGYIEVLWPTADTPIGLEIRAGIARHIGVHLAAFGVADAKAHHRRLVDAGFPQRPVVSLTRKARLLSGDERILRFTVARPERGSLPEGRVQFLTHHTASIAWEGGRLAHPNGANGLTDLFFCVADIEEAIERYRLYLNRPFLRIEGGARFALDRGFLWILDEAGTLDRIGLEPPCLPWMAGYALAFDDPSQIAKYALQSGLRLHTASDGLATIILPSVLGGAIVLHRGSYRSGL
ncbi:VOC family protein [Thioalkalivibrio sp. HK1]|uniref:VOC family protein n=1 Tax=Thioalkalivibrio sp. HK1 TaxID=1469245 RepID=UPI00046E9470|nr:VOC family protein [Thioalkalivibrio sp. HK1]